jgi:hypothetical protein
VLEPVRVAESDLSQRSAATAVVDNLLDYTTDVAIALSLSAISPASFLDPRALPARAECGLRRTKSRVRNWAGALFRRVLAVKIEPRPFL